MRIKGEVVGKIFFSCLVGYLTCFLNSFVVVRVYFFTNIGRCWKVKFFFMEYLLIFLFFMLGGRLFVFCR